MFKNYVKIALRNIIRHKFYTGINIIGLSIGLMCATLILLFIQNELSYDKHHEKHERIYRLESHFSIPGQKDEKLAKVVTPLAPPLKDEYPEIEEYVRFMYSWESSFTYKDKTLYDENFWLSDSTVFNVFTHPFIKGTPKNALSEPNTIVLTETFAKKLFGEENPIGETVASEDGELFEVTGVIEDLPDNSHFKFTGLISMITRAGWENFNVENPIFLSFNFADTYSYVLLKENADINNVLNNFQPFYDKYLLKAEKYSNISFRPMATPLAKIHYHSKLDGDEPTGNMAYIYIFSAIAFLILIIACINYMNMATARSASRAREVGIRKVVGAQKFTLMGQFLIESLIISLIAFVISICAAELLLPTFNYLSGKNLNFGIETPDIYILMFGVTVIVGLISGSYPAFYLSAFLPIHVLKGKMITDKKGGLFRKVLVVFQFSISIIMIIGAFLVSSQLKYFRNKDMGFDKENIIVTTIRDTTIQNSLNALIEELEKNPKIVGVAATDKIPGEPGFRRTMQVENDGELTKKALNFIAMDDTYFDLMGFEIVEGNNYSTKVNPGLDEGFLINEAAVTALGWNDDPIGKTIKPWLAIDDMNRIEGKVIGVVKDYNQNSLHNKIEPLVFIRFYRKFLDKLVIKIHKGNTLTTIEDIKSVWQEFCPDCEFDFIFLDESLNNLYIAEQKLGKIFSYFAVLTIFISCLGLLGLSSFMTERRTKEIAIRKIMGAEVSDILYCLLKDFLILIVIANIFAWPIAYYSLDKWLKNFAYRTNISIWMFVISAFIAAFIALLTIAYRVIKAATANPINCLRYE